MKNTSINRYEEKFFVHPHSTGWAVECDNNSPLSYSFKEKSKAIKAAKELAKKHHTEVVIQKQDGSIENKLTYP
jgi:uncharacterized protein YdaT